MRTMQFLVPLLLASYAIAHPALSSDHEQLGKRAYETYASNKVRGVNLGGWGILEPWITPSIFENVDQSLGIVDEYTLTQKLSVSVASGILYSHWSTFYTIGDFEAIANAGINTVRIPVGYWAFVLVPGDPYIQGFAQYLDQGITWAQQYGLKVWIDLHGAPGSQNGFDNSGRRGPIDWGTDSTINYTQQALQAIVSKYSVAPYAGTVVGIEILNEPSGYVIAEQTIKNFYTYGIDLIRQANSNMLFVIHDAFLSLYDWTSFPSSSDIANGVLDTHHYEVFGTTFDLEGQITDICNFGTYSLIGAEYSIATVVGEFTGAQTDCTKYLNGYGYGARYDGTLNGADYVGNCAATNENGEISEWTNTQRTNTRKLIEAQLDAYDKGAGWIFWTAKTESSPYWDFLRLVDGGIFPQPFTERTYPGQCG